MTTGEQLRSVLRVIESGPERPRDVRAALTCPGADARPLPQLTWTVLALAAYRERLRWAWKTVFRRLPQQVLWAFRTRGEVSGAVPGLPDWGYHLAWAGVTLSHRGTGKRLPLDFLEGPECIIFDDFVSHYGDQRSPDPAEGRLQELLPRGAGLPVVLRSLGRCGLVRGRCDLEISPQVTRRSDAIAAFLARYADPDERPWLAAAVGDWPAAHDAAVALGEADVAGLLAPLAQRCRRRWLNRLRGAAGRHGVYAAGIDALAHAGAEDLPRYIGLALADPDEAPAAAGLIAEDPSWCPRVYRLLAKGRKRWKDRWEHVYPAYAEYLGRHRHRVGEVIDLLLADREPPLDLLIPLALEHRRDLVLPLLRRALRSEDHPHRRTAAAVLALFDTAWSRGELAALLEEADDWEMTAECRLALADSSDPDTRQLAAGWEADWPDQAADRELFQERVSELFDLVMRHRTYVPEGGPDG